MNTLQNHLKRIDGKGYKAYKSIQGNYKFSKYQLYIDYVQGDPFASPSRIRIVIPEAVRPIRKEWRENKHRKIYVADRIARSVAVAIQKQSSQAKGSGKSGLIYIDRPGQEILERTAVMIGSNEITICFSIGLPANGRRINGQEAERVFFKHLPSILSVSIFSLSEEELTESAHLADQHKEIRKQMKRNGWIAFIADGSILPRQSGISNKPLNSAVPFKSPEENRVEMAIPHRNKPLTGMAVKQGINLIVGGGYHGKSTLLQAIERGVYHHIRGDGREYVLTDENAVKIRAEDGRQINAVNISMFINNLPHGQDTKKFTTENASGSTSQAANVVEALEAGASALLIDEDTSATNFMIRDARMNALINRSKEPITPFIDKIKQLYVDRNISTILVMGGSGDYFDVSNDVIMMDQYQPYNVTAETQSIVRNYPLNRSFETVNNPLSLAQRVFLRDSLAVYKGKKKKVQARGLSQIIMGKTTVDLSYVEQLIDNSQTNMIAEIISYLEKKKILDKERTLAELLDYLESLMDEKGIQIFGPFPNQHPGDLARPRRFEIAACLNRMRGARLK
ncbi:Predicted ATPase of the ABC class [Gracilibacillus ureilyticus]|uniref:Predicted ATPase of the ABC class n=1 Tax=Gracilibacillus ureilyticus TaxID=531814 RepID=A0A1H9PKR5_9BACI|nr:ABC-ATPase domain-containing protein [Gracilibacillus ureilyticus]SER48173.1 Predicted ATPase of the ABC class [Gracilibacillus ureilyticus]